jgi:hypothetical protein
MASARAGLTSQEIDNWAVLTLPTIPLELPCE